MIPINLRISRLIESAVKLKKYPSESTAIDQTISEASSDSMNVRILTFLYPENITENQ